jgi:cytosine/adenosine deaminase-related metal-dependent hydrolase
MIIRHRVGRSHSAAVDGAQRATRRAVQGRYSGISDELLIAGGLILDPDLPLATGDVRVRGGLVVEVGGDLPREGADVLDARGLIVTPGLINAHTHSNQSVQRGSAPNLPLELWIGCVLYGDGPMAADDVYTAAAFQALELLRTGCTAVLDHAFLDVGDLPAQAEAIMQAYADVGMRAAVAPVVQDLDYLTTVATGLAVEAEAPEPMTSPRDAPAILAALDAFLTAWAGKHELLTPMLGPAAPQRCSDELLAGLAELVLRHGAGVHTHLLESKPQVLATRSRFGSSVVAHLDELGLLGAHASFAHCNWLDGDEYRTLARTGSVVVHNPITAIRCGSGLLPLQELLDDGPTIALGADGSGASDGQNMFEAMKLASLLHTLYGDHRRWPQPERIWRVGLHGGAAALRRPLGAIRPGAAADLVLLRPDRHAVDDKDYLVRSLVVSELGDSVDTVLVGGEVVLRERRSTRVDEAAIRADAHELMGRRCRQHLARRDVYSAVEPFLASVVDEAAAIDLGFSRRAEIELAREAAPTGGAAA